MLLWQAVAREDHGTARRLHAALLRLWNALAGDNLPANVKQALDLQGCPGLHPRAPMPAASAEQRHAIDQALRALDAEVKRST